MEYFYYWTNNAPPPDVWLFFVLNQDFEVVHMDEGCSIVKVIQRAEPSLGTHVFFSSRSDMINRKPDDLDCGGKRETARQKAIRTAIILKLLDIGYIDRTEIHGENE
jgi:hypothetical protein